MEFYEEICYIIIELFSGLEIIAMITVGICEDVNRERYYLRKLLKNVLNEKKIVYQLFDYSNGNDLLNNNDISLFDLFFLDIEMPDMDGILLGKKIREINKIAKIIYVTGHKGYLAVALEVTHCFLYLEKPITAQLIDEKLMTVFEYMKEKKAKIEIIVNKKKTYFSPEDIYYFEHVGRKTIVFTKHAGVLETVTPLKEIVVKIGKAGFAEPHRGYLVSLANVRGIQSDIVILTNNQKLKLSQRKIANFKTQYNAYLQEFLF